MYACCIYIRVKPEFVGELAAIDGAAGGGPEAEAAVNMYR